MSIDPSEVLQAALSLPDEERAGMAYRLLQSLTPPAVMSDADPALQTELERRVSAYEAGQSIASDWDQVSERLRSALKNRGSS